VADGQDSLHNGSVDEKSLGDLVSRVSENASVLIREEIELAKAEIELKLTSLIRGIAIGAAAGFFVFLALIFFFEGLSWGISDLLGNGYGWAGYFVTTGILVLSAAIAGLLARRFIKAGTPPTPQQAIEEAKKVRETLEHPERELATGAGPGA
jgi:H+/Cl- antiporter ClcA